MKRRRLVQGNWKMNGVRADLEEIGRIDRAAGQLPDLEVGLFLPATILHSAAVGVRSIFVGGQECHAAHAGPYTGCLSARMLCDAGATAVLLGHSESRRRSRLADAEVSAAAQTALQQGLAITMCVGEETPFTDEDAARATLLGQLAASLPSAPSADALTIAYEPVWCIGAGRIPAAHYRRTVFAALRDGLTALLGRDARHIPILYGGSVEADCVVQILSDPQVDGLLVGGASLRAARFKAILREAAQGG